jgi:hypothetical protein
MLAPCVKCKMCNVRSVCIGDKLVGDDSTLAMLSRNGSSLAERERFSVSVALWRNGSALALWRNGSALVYR